MAQAKAILRNHPTSPRKMRYVVDAIRGLDVEKALDVLKFSTKHSSTAVERLLVSAINNWKQANEGARAEDAGLYIKEIFVDAGTTIKRFLPAPHGRAYKMKKRSNHVTVVVDSRVQMQETKEPAENAGEATPEGNAEQKVAEKPKRTRTAKTGTKKTAKA